MKFCLLDCVTNLNVGKPISDLKCWSITDDCNDSKEFNFRYVVGDGNIIAPGRIVPKKVKISPPDHTIILGFNRFTT